MPSMELEWGGKKYTIPEDQMFEMCEAIERHVTLPDLMLMVGQGKPNFSALARPFHAMLTQAGVRDVPSMLELRRMLVMEGLDNLKSQSDGTQPVSQTAMTAIATMVEILMDGAPEQEAEPDAKKTKPRSSKAATKSRSGNGASRRKTSGA